MWWKALTKAVSQKAQWWAMAFIYMLTSLYSITAPGWHQSNSVKAQCSTEILYYTSQDEGWWDWKASSQRTARPMVSHSIIPWLIWNTAVCNTRGTHSAGTVHRESMLWRKTSPVRQVFMHSLTLSEIPGQLELKSIRFLLQIARSAHKQNSLRDIHKMNAFPSDNVTSLPV